MGKKINDPSIPSGLGQADGSYLLPLVHPTTGKIYRVPASVILGLFNTQPGAYTLLLSDWGKTVEIDSSSAVNVTVPSGLPANFFCSIIQKGTGAVSLVAGTGVTIRGGLTLGGQNAIATIMARAQDDFYALTGGAGSGTTTGGGGTGATQLNAPTGLAATSISATEIDLAWTDTNSSPNDSGYKIYRNASNTFGTATLIATTAANATTYNDTAVPNPSTLYYYWAVAKGDGTTTSDSVASASASATSGAAGPIFANFTSSELSEQPSGSHIYKPVSATGATYNHRGMDAHKLAGTSDGNVITTVDATLQGSGQFVLGLSPSSTALDAYTSFTVAVRPIIGSGVQVFEGGGSAGIHGSVADGNLVRINTNKAAMQATIDVSTDGGTTWTTVYTSANLKVYNGTAYVPVGDVYCHAAVYDDAGIKNTTLTNFS